ncbi:MAG: hypothetical protein HC767_01955 [Akkermansiaceae bacterium]|nr:hypothetical protein [Akkermansiaceae bacterium]
MSKLEAEDPEYMAAVREYNQQLSKREVLSLDHLLLRVNSAAHMRSAVSKITDKVRREYEHVLEEYSMDKAKELSALEGALEGAAEVRLGAFLLVMLLCTPLKCMASSMSLRL